MIDSVKEKKKDENFRNKAYKKAKRKDEEYQYREKEADKELKQKSVTEFTEDKIFSLSKDIKNLFTDIIDKDLNENI